jgi:hypothetical protein
LFAAASLSKGASWRSIQKELACNERHATIAAGRVLLLDALVVGVLLDECIIHAMLRHLVADECNSRTSGGVTGLHRGRTSPQSAIITRHRLQRTHEQTYTLPTSREAMDTVSQGIAAAPM